MNETQNLKSESTPVRRPSILAVDDDPSVLRLLTLMLVEMGFEVVTVDNSAKALETYRSAMKSGEKFDAAILDLVMPQCDGGVELAKKILQKDPGAQLIASSGEFNSDVRMDCSQAGFAGFVEKPYNVSQLQAAVSAYLRR